MWSPLINNDSYSITPDTVFSCIQPGLGYVSPVVYYWKTKLASMGNYVIVYRNLLYCVQNMRQINRVMRVFGLMVPSNHDISDLLSVASNYWSFFVLSMGTGPI